MAICATCGRGYAGQACPFCRFGAPQAARGPQVAQPVQGPVPLAPNTLPGGANLILKCVRAGQLNLIDINPAQTLYILRGTRIDFRVAATGVPPGTNVNLAPTTWGGTSGLNGSGLSKQVDFAVAAAVNLPANAVTVTASFGGQTVTVNCLVFDITPTATPVDNFATRSQDDLGVDERCTLGFATVPPGISAANAGGLRWVFDNNAANNRDTIGILHDPANHAAATPNTGLATYVAPCRTAPAGQAPVPSVRVTLRLVIQTGPCATLGPGKTYNIHTPVAHMREEAGANRRHVNGQPSAGFYGEIFLTPLNVSFRTLRWREGRGKLEVTGNFPVAWANMDHQYTAFGNAQHGTVGAGNVVFQRDNVYSGAFAYTPPPRASDITEAGRQRWPIEWQYTYPDLAPPHNWTNVWVSMQRAYHVATLYQSGRMEIFKGHVRCAQGACMAAPISKNLGDPTVA